MQPSSGNSRAWPHWPCAAALALIVAAPPAFANGGGGDQVERNSSQTDIAGPIENPCNSCTILFQGTQKTQTRNTQKANGESEFRFEQTTRGEGPEDCSQVNYKVDETQRLNTRSNRKMERSEQHFRQRGNPQFPVVKTPANQLAAGWLIEEKNETRQTPFSTRNERESEMKCRDRNGDGIDD
jgi:hypothetical protein